MRRKTTMSENFKVTRVVAETDDGRVVQLLGAGNLTHVTTWKKPDKTLENSGDKLEPYDYWSMEFRPSLPQWFNSLDRSPLDELPPSPDAPKES
jgi:hypothetical protein